MQLLASLHNENLPFWRAGAGRRWDNSLLCVVETHRARGDAVRDVEVFFGEARATAGHRNQVHVGKTQRRGDWHWKTHTPECQYTTEIQPHVARSALDTSTQCTFTWWSPVRERVNRHVWVGCTSVKLFTLYWQSLQVERNTGNFLQPIKLSIPSGKLNVPC